MAITGSGTEQDPFIVHSYDEIRTAANLSSGSNYTYIKLGNNINCNDYGDYFEWETITLGTSGVNVCILDLDNHYIKNVKVKEDNSMFSLIGFSGNNAEIKNGKLLNIFLQDANYAVLGTAGTRLFKVATSLDATGIKIRPFQQCKIEECSVYIQSSKLLTGLFYRNYTTAMLINSDLQLVIDNLNGQRIFETSDGNINTYFSGCRITGKAKGQAYSEHLMGYGYLSDCVVNFDVSETYYAGSFMRSPSTGVVNTDIIPTGLSIGGMKGVTSAEIINGDALRAKGFSVYNVG